MAEASSLAKWLRVWITRLRCRDGDRQRSGAWASTVHVEEPSTHNKSSQQKSSASPTSVHEGMSTSNDDGEVVVQPLRVQVTESSEIDRKARLTHGSTANKFVLAEKRVFVRVRGDGRGGADKMLGICGWRGTSESSSASGRSRCGQGLLALGAE